jgi:hypothetical protein
MKNILTTKNEETPIKNLMKFLRFTKFFLKDFSTLKAWGTVPTLFNALMCVYALVCLCGFFVAVHRILCFVEG